MHMQVSRLREALTLLQPAVPKKTSIVILKNVLLKEGKAAATNLETAVIIDLPEVTETCLVPFEQVSEVVKLIPGTDEISIEVGKNLIRLEWPGGKASYPTADAIDFPELNKFDAPVIMGDVNGDALIHALAPMVKYAATEESRPILKAVHLFLGEKVAAAAADGFRLVYQELPMSLGKEGTISIETGTIDILDYLWKRIPYIAPEGKTFFEKVTAPRKMTVGIGDEGGSVHTWVGFRYSRMKVIAKLVIGSPPNILSLIPKPTNSVKILAQPFKQAVMRAKDIASSSSDIIRLKWTESEMDIYAVTAEMGEISTVIPCVSSDGPGKVGLSVKYLLEYLNGKEGLVTFGQAAGTGPVLFELSNAPTTLIMPMMVQW
jgi:DNA polymerase III sliding clamp (beta) subunit (PCNA family)